MIKISLTVVSLFLVAIACVYLFWLSGDQPLFALTGTTPTNLGVNDHKLASCPSSPNCVSSQAIDPQHYIAPIQYQSSTTEAFTKLKQVMQSQKRTQIISQTDNYIYAQTTSRLMGFVDDVEFYLPPSPQSSDTQLSGTQLIEVRSASRIGDSDLGVNRQRIEQIRLNFNDLTRS